MDLVFGSFLNPLNVDFANFSDFRLSLCLTFCRFLGLLATFDRIRMFVQDSFERFQSCSVNQNRDAKLLQMCDILGRSGNRSTCVA